eukprot:1160261-Pelagomonas_calceolata.AAC.6
MKSHPSCPLLPLHARAFYSNNMLLHWSPKKSSTPVSSPASNITAQHQPEGSELPILAKKIGV